MKLLFSLTVLCLFGQNTITIAQETVRFSTSDGVRIVADWYAPDVQSRAFLLLLHMNRSNRSAWTDFASFAHSKGYAILAIDLRGHGESTTSDGGDIPFDSLGLDDYAKMIKDVDAAVNWIELQAADRDLPLGIIGASIGANVALCYAADHASVGALGLLSPGLDYRGVKTEPALELYGARPVLIIAAENDNYSAVSSRKLASESGSGTELFLYPSGGHGTFLFETQPDLSDTLIRFLNTNLLQKN